MGPLIYFTHAYNYGVVAGQKKENLTQMTSEICAQAGVSLDRFLYEISGLCKSLLVIAKDCCDYSPSDMEKPKIRTLVEHCFTCADEMLNCQHEQGKYYTYCK